MDRLKRKNQIVVPVRAPSGDVRMRKQGLNGPGQRTVTANVNQASTNNLSRRISGMDITKQESSLEHT